MPVRFTCRLLVVRTASGKLRVQYGYLDDECERLLIVCGPKVLAPPDEEMTEEEFERWEFRMHEMGFSTTVEATPPDAPFGRSPPHPIVEAKRTYEDVIPKGVVKAELFWAENREGERTLAVQVTNGWDDDVPKISLSTVFRYDAPQPANIPGVPAQWVGGNESMPRIDSPGGKDLYPGQTAVFAVSPRFLETTRSRAASLSTESHWIALLTDGYEFDRIPGETVGDVLDEAESR